LIEGKEYAMELVEREGLRYVNGYDDPAIIAGAGSCGLEMLEAVPDLDAMVVPVGGGGLIAGIAIAAKAMNPAIRIIGVEPERAASLKAALAAGQPVQASMEPTLADGLAVSVVGTNAFAILRELLDDLVLVDESEIARAILRLAEQEKAVVEGAGATAVAALLAGKVPGVAGKKVGVPLCGGNIDMAMLGRIIARGLAADGRVCRFSAQISDRPGGLARFAQVLAEEGASIIDVTHDRVFGGDQLANVAVLCSIQTRDEEHIVAILSRLEREGIPTNRHTVPR
jgi:threonine dehydratase